MATNNREYWVDYLRAEIVKLLEKALGKKIEEVKRDMHEVAKEELAAKYGFTDKYERMKALKDEITAAEEVVKDLQEERKRLGFETAQYAPEFIANRRYHYEPTFFNIMSDEVDKRQAELVQEHLNQNPQAKELYEAYMRVEHNIMLASTPKALADFVKSLMEKFGIK